MPETYQALVIRAREEALRFVRCAEAFHLATGASTHVDSWWPEFNKERAAMKRASMDLSRTMAQLRQFGRTK